MLDSPPRSALEKAIQEDDAQPHCAVTSPDLMQEAPEAKVSRSGANRHLLHALSEFFKQRMAVVAIGPNLAQFESCLHENLDVIHQVLNRVEV